MFFLSSTENDDKCNTMVRNAQRKDVSELATTIVACFYDFPPILSWINPLLKLTISEDLRYRLQNSPLLYCCLVATKNSQIAGTVEISLQQPWWAITAQSPYISNLAVKKNYRRQGIAKKLLTQCEQVSRNWGYREIRLHVLADNHSAQKLYLGMGYKCISEETSWHFLWPNYSSRLLMKKELDNLD
ncbi:MAG: GNAT family N-acetyltransferase [Xenococcus sp. MO_188.B8]|nr:GNAT family N-acetyltransferase [Xenococcus sp. MO_188.B8]